MNLPLLDYAPSSQNQRVIGYEVPGDEQPRSFTTENMLSPSEMDDLIQAAYRQIFHEQQMLQKNRQLGLESQLKSGNITVRDFIRGLVVSENFRVHNYEPNSNYRVVQLCVQRLLGRDIYSDRETLAWSIVLATQGLYGFVDALLESDEYLSSFGDHTVPYQRRRILPQRSQGDHPFARMPRYGADYRQKLEDLGNQFSATGTPGYRWSWQQPPYARSARVAGAAIAVFGSSFVGLLAIATVLSWFGVIHL
ncbi:MAG: phycobilisome rod-core linker polypeptide [Synechococcales cyanobacterium K44_A2020_017]|uniref:phycobilisome rod-core linker polypeptide n=1 Tax=Leptolyngbya sp. CCY15150 TaxID=2767772 RepID=UPI00194FFEDF|nr:phycobilisome rod-core linker polypeptide [Leptolyngbya sp. CCY15150]MBF2087718.1 phycobilisome rod-core linker polypeptide [Synechococcales cyanobacterium K32_A2020_035]MBF2096340.1 phycobilisome rod-core linker polypeptide [Synechococcales cyanobacterium K44_A2020_017]